jgi:hypothetical protein
MVFANAKHFRVFETSVFLETKVLSKYFKNTELPNRA